MKSGLLQICMGMIMGCSFLIHQSHAQSYHPMPTGPAQWNMARCWYFYPAGWHDLYYITMDGADTVINQKVYKKLYHTTHHAPGTEFDSTYTHFLGGMRESGKQIFMISEWLCLDTIERMIYDFNDVSVGDTIYSQVLTNGLTQFIPHIVTGLDEVEINGSTRRQILLQDESGFFNESWIEGIGSSLGLVYASYWLLTDNSYDLNCFYEGNNLHYSNPFPTYAFCTAPFPDSECAPVITATDPEPDPISLTLFPNPVFSALAVQSSALFKSVEIVNAMGIKVCVIPFEPYLNLIQLPAGMYFLRFQGSVSRQSVVRRIVKV